MKKVFFLILLLTLTSLFAQDTIIRVAYSNWRPYSYTENGKAVGIELDIFEAVTSMMGYKAEFEEYPWKRCLRLLQIGEVDVVISMVYNDDRSVYTIYPEEHITIADFMFFSLQEKTIEYDGYLTSLKNYDVGSILGFYYGEDYINAEFRKKIEVGDPDILLKLVLNGRLDIGLGNRTVINNSLYYLKSDQSLIFYDPPVRSDKLFVGFSKINKLEALAKQFSKSLKAFKETDSYRNILKRYHTD